MKGKWFLASFSILIAVAMTISCGSTGGGKSEPETPVVPYTWNFDDPAAGTAGWEVIDSSGFWQYSGPAVLSRDDTTFGKPMLRFDVDFTNDKGRDWSEPKLEYSFPEPLAMRGYTKFVYDFYYNPGLSSGGHFKSKIVGVKGVNFEALTDAINGTEDAGNGFLKATVTLSVRRVSGNMGGMVLSIAGYLTDYKGPVFFDNLRWE